MQNIFQKLEQIYRKMLKLKNLLENNNDKIVKIQNKFIYLFYKYVLSTILSLLFFQDNLQF